MEHIKLSNFNFSTGCVICRRVATFPLELNETLLTPNSTCRRLKNVNLSLIVLKDTLHRTDEELIGSPYN